MLFMSVNWRLGSAVNIIFKHKIKSRKRLKQKNVICFITMENSVAKGAADTAKLNVHITVLYKQS